MVKYAHPKYYAKRAVGYNARKREAQSGCGALIVAVLVVGAIIFAVMWPLSLWGHALHLTPSWHQLMHRDKAWLHHHYPLVGLRYLAAAAILLAVTVTVVVTVLAVGGLLWLVGSADGELAERRPLERVGSIDGPAATRILDFFGVDCGEADLASARETEACTAQQDRAPARGDVRQVGPAARDAREPEHRTPGEVARLAILEGDRPWRRNEPPADPDPQGWFKRGGSGER
jgi:hypothetical protein